MRAAGRGERSASRGRSSTRSRRQRRKFNGQLDFLGEVADVILHPETAAEHGIVDGQKVRVYNKAGDIFVTAVLDPTMRRGVASIPHGHKDANVNFLTCADDYGPAGRHGALQRRADRNPAGNQVGAEELSWTPRNRRRP